MAAVGLALEVGVDDQKGQPHRKSKFEVVTGSAG